MLLLLLRYPKELHTSEPNCLHSPHAEFWISEDTASWSSRRSKDAKERYARTHKRNLSYAQVNLVHCKCRCRWSSSRGVQKQTGPAGWALCGQDTSSEETYCDDFKWYLFQISWQDREVMWVSFRGGSVFTSHNPLGARISSINPQTACASVNSFVLFPSSGRNS